MPFSTAIRFNEIVKNANNLKQLHLPMMLVSQDCNKNKQNFVVMAAWAVAEAVAYLINRMHGLCLIFMRNSERVYVTSVGSPRVKVTLWQCDQ